jgi:hypothetical protein
MHIKLLNIFIFRYILKYFARELKNWFIFQNKIINIDFGFYSQKIYFVNGNYSLHATDILDVHLPCYIYAVYCCKSYYLDNIILYFDFVPSFA